MPYIGTCFRFYTQMRVQKTNKQSICIQNLQSLHTTVQHVLVGRQLIYVLTMSNKFFSTLEYGKAGNKCKALKIWQKYMLILKKYCSVFQIEEITSSNNKLSTTHSTFPFLVYAVQLQNKMEQNRTQNFQKFRHSNTRMYFLEKL